MAETTARPGARSTRCASAKKPSSLSRTGHVADRRTDQRLYERLQRIVVVIVDLRPAIVTLLN